jgi:hypothetical protein
MMRFLLVHGAWHGAWCWERAAALTLENTQTFLKSATLFASTLAAVFGTRTAKNTARLEAAN